VLGGDDDRVRGVEDLAALDTLHRGIAEVFSA
jgi:hypothetical protein